MKYELKNIVTGSDTMKTSAIKITLLMKCHGKSTWHLSVPSQSRTYAAGWEICYLTDRINGSYAEWILV